MFSPKYSSCLLLVLLLNACSRNEEQKPATSLPAPPPALSPLQLTTTNQPVTAPPPSLPRENAKIEQGFAVKKAGNLFLTFPGTWKDSIMRVRETDKVFDAVKFLPSVGDEFAVMVEIINVGAANAKNLDARAVPEKAGQAELKNAVEKSLAIHDLQGTAAAGCYFTITDKAWTKAAPHPGQYLYLTQGYATLGGLVLNFRLVSNRVSPEQEAMLEMIMTARLEKK